MRSECLAKADLGKQPLEYHSKDTLSLKRSHAGDAAFIDPEQKTRARQPRSSSFALDFPCLCSHRGDCQEGDNDENKHVDDHGAIAPRTVPAPAVAEYTWTERKPRASQPRSEPGASGSTTASCKSASRSTPRRPFCHRGTCTELLPAGQPWPSAQDHHARRKCQRELRCQR